MHDSTMAEERVARALHHLNEDAGFLSATDSVLELIEDYFDSDDPPGNVQPHPTTALTTTHYRTTHSSCMHA